MAIFRLYMKYLLSSYTKYKWAVYKGYEKWHDKENYISHMELYRWGYCDISLIYVKQLDTANN